MVVVLRKTSIPPLAASATGWRSVLGLGLVDDVAR